MITDAHFPAKLLLFGEYTVLKGSQALAMPLTQFGGTWQYSDDLKKQYDLPKLAQYIKKLVENGQIRLDTEGVEKALAEGLYFHSDIPRGYGVGSSGALVAALYDKFGMDKTLTINELKTILGLIESCFHGSSSGIDPLVSYIKKTILIKPDKNLMILDNAFNPPSNDFQVFLLDTHIRRKTEPLVRFFLEKCTLKNEYNTLITNELVPLIDEAIHLYINNNCDALLSIINQISGFQYKYFPEMIPLPFKNLWLEGLSSTAYTLKLCGAGGGGFILGFCRNIEKATQEIAKSGFSIKAIS